MKVFSLVVLAAVVLLPSGTVAASTIYYAGSCGDFFVGTTFSPPNSISGTFDCPTPASLGVALPISAEFVVYDSDYSSGLAPDVSMATNWTFSGATFAFSTDTTTVTGNGIAGTPVSSDGLTLNPFTNLPPLILEGFYDSVDSTSGFGTPTIEFSSKATAGSALENTGYVEVVYATGTNLAAVPEPSEQVLIGTGLIALFFSRKFARGQRRLSGDCEHERHPGTY